MKKVILGMLAVLSLSQSAVAGITEITGVTDTGAPVKQAPNAPNPFAALCGKCAGVLSQTTTAAYYVIHGGCRAATNPKLTEIWLYFGTRPNISYNPESYDMIRAMMYLEQPVNSVSSILTCNILRNARFQQFPLKINLQPDPVWTDHKLVKSIDGASACVAAAYGFTTDPVYLENFSVTPENRR